MTESLTGYEAGLKLGEEMSLLALEQLESIAIHCHPRERLADALPYLNAAMQEFAINTPLRVAHFLAQICHESDGLNTLEEYASGADYEGRDDLGNIHEGDGEKYKGRGLIQITGRANYTDCGNFLGLDLANNPELLADWENGTRSAGWFWHVRDLNVLAEVDDLDEITLAINGGFNGFADRAAYLERAKKAL
jgi:putative chitinase